MAVSTSDLDILTGFLFKNKEEFTNPHDLLSQQIMHWCCHFRENGNPEKQNTGYPPMLVWHISRDFHTNIMNYTIK